MNEYYKEVMNMFYDQSNYILSVTFTGADFDLNVYITISRPRMRADLTFKGDLAWKMAYDLLIHLKSFQ